MRPRLRFALLAAAIALGLAGVWARAANVKPGARTWRAVRVWYSLARDRDLDVFDQPSGPERSTPGPGPRDSGLSNATSALLGAPLCAAVAGGEAARGAMPFEDVRRLGLALSAFTLCALLIGIGLVARALVRSGHEPVTALLASTAATLALPLATRLAAQPDPALALAYVLSAVLFSWRGDEEISIGARALVAALVVALEPAGIVWAAVVLWELCTLDPDAELDMLFGVAVAALVAVPVYGLVRVGEPGGAGIFETCGVLAPLAAAAFARARIAPALCVAVWVGAALSAELAARAGAAMPGPGAALAWSLREGGRAVSEALLPSDVFESWVGFAADVRAPWWGALALASGAAVGGVAVRRVPSGLALAGLAASGATALAGLYFGALGPRELHALAWAGDPAIVDTAVPVVRWHPPQGVRASRVDLEIVQRGWGAIAAGEPLARLVVSDDGGRELELPIAAAEGTRRVRFALPWSLAVREVRLERRHAVAQVTVRGLWLGAVRGRVD